MENPTELKIIENRFLSFTSTMKTRIMPRKIDNCIFCSIDVSGIRKQCKEEADTFDGVR